MPAVRLAQAGLVALTGLAVIAGCGGCSGGASAARDGGPRDGNAAGEDAGRTDSGPHRDAGRWCDGGCPPPAAQVAWDHVVLSAPHDQISIAGMVVLPTGIAILAPPKYILLADKTDGHLIAKAPWPTWQNGMPSHEGGAIARASGNLAVLMDDYPSSGEEMAVHEYAGADLSAANTTVVSKNIGLSVIGELSGEIYVLSHAGPTVDTLYLYSLPDGGSVQTQVLATGSGAAPTVLGSFPRSPDGGLLACGFYFRSAPPAILRIDPPKTITTVLSLSGSTGSGDCRLIAGPDRDLAIWSLGHETPHWDIVSADGTKLMSTATGPNAALFSIAYSEGAFASVTTPENRAIYLYVTDADTAAVRGPYSVQVPVPNPSIGTPAIAGEGDNLWVAYDEYYTSGAIHLAKLGPLPPK